MEYTTWPEMHPNPNPNPPQPITLTTSSDSSTHFSYDSSLPQHPIITSQFYTYTDPNTIATTATSSSSYPLPHGYCSDPSLQNWAAKAAALQYGSDPAVYSAAVGATVALNGTEQLAIAHTGSTMWTDLTILPQGNNPWTKRPKKTKVVQSAYCEICKVSCNSKDVLDQHKLGKKHKKNLEKLRAAAAGDSAPAGSSNPAIIGPQENPDKGKTGDGQKSKKKPAEPLQDLETKRRKIVEGGAAVEAVRTCAICNVVCNSETVFNYHLAGQKHAAMAKKHAAGMRMAAAT